MKRRITIKTITERRVVGMEGGWNWLRIVFNGGTGY
jgi:hypothetical protein